MVGKIRNQAKTLSEKPEEKREEEKERISGISSGEKSYRPTGIRPVAVYRGNYELQLSIIFKDHRPILYELVQRLLRRASVGDNIVMHSLLHGL